jgi:hypothetical protein
VARPYAVDATASVARILYADDATATTTIAYGRN